MVVSRQPGGYDPPMNTIFAIGLGGAIGSIARYLTISFCGRLCGAEFPWGTLAVNIIGSFVMGTLAGAFAYRWSADQAVRAFLTTGILGGYTTFSSFSLDTAQLLERGATASASFYILASVALSLGGLFTGLFLMRWSFA